MKQPLVLIVDDNHDSRMIIRGAFRKHRYLFLEAQDGEEGVQKAKTHNPDLIIMDVMMPGLSGYEALAQLKKDEATKNIPVLIVTAMASMNEKIFALESGAEDLWSKPFNRLDLVRQVEMLIGIRKQQLKTQTNPIETEEIIDQVFHRQSEELIHYYYTDALTGLANRSQLIKDIQNVKNSSLLLIDIDRFKDIVYFYGHEIGDLCLKSFGIKIKQILASDNYKHYRISGDIFAVLIKKCSGYDALENMMKMFLNEIDGFNFACGGHEIHFRITLGGSVFTDELLVSAEKALKTAKASNKTMMIFDEFSEEFRSYEQNIFWNNKINEAIQNNQIIPYYQPILNHQNDTIEKYECLVRMIDNDGKVHSPIKFLDISKKSRNYAAITKSVIDKAFHKFADLDYQFSINLSAKDMMDNDISEYIYSKLAQFKGCERVIFELLESEGIANYNSVYNFIKQVKKYGCQIAIDDFGSGYSNFIHLLRLKVDIIKIDGSLICDLDSDENAQMIIKTIVEFSNKLNIVTVAEFVHSEKIKTIVQELGVHYSQGYFIGHPNEELV